MAWLNSDDIYLPGAIQSAVDFLESHPEVGMVYGDTDLINGQGEKIGQFNAQQTSFKRLMRGGVYIPQPAAFWRRELWEKAGPLDPNFYFAMDYDLWVRFAKAGQVRHEPELWAAFRMHGAGKTTLDNQRCWPEMRQVHKREGGRLFSLFMAKYTLRLILGPVWTWIKRKQLGL